MSVGLQRSGCTGKRRLHPELVFHKKQRRFRTIEVLENWELQYLESLPRYKFLVLEGSDRTSYDFAANRTSPDKFLTVVCSSSKEPDMRLYDPWIHEVVLWLGATPDLVLRVKTLAQASMQEVHLGRCATNVAEYVVWFHRVKLIVASDEWSANLTL